MGNNDASRHSDDEDTADFREIRVKNQITLGILVARSNRLPGIATVANELAAESSISSFFTKTLIPDDARFPDSRVRESASLPPSTPHFTPTRIEPNRSFASAFETVVVRKFKAPVESQPPGSVRLSLFTVFSVKCGTLVASPATSQQPVRAGTVCAEALTVSHETNA